MSQDSEPQPPPMLSRASTVGSTAAAAASSYLPSTISKFLRRLSSDTTLQDEASKPSSLQHSATFPSSTADEMSVYTPKRTASPFAPPPLYPLTLKGYRDSTTESARLLTRAIAEEIRLLVPPRLQLVEDWHLVYSLEQNGVSLGTMYKKCSELRGLRNGYVLVVKDGEGGLFGAYLSEAPHISAHYFGNGECFLWRATTFSPSTVTLNDLPPPPSADTTNVQRSTTINQSTSTTNPSHPLPHLSSSSALSVPTPAPSRPQSPSRIRFKAFPYSGVNDYFMLCETGFFSIGGGDGNYGLWLDSTFERGISSTCLTFGNEPLSEEGMKFDVLGVELWCVGSLP